MLGPADATDFGKMSCLFIIVSPLFLLFAAIKVFFTLFVNMFYAIGSVMSCAYCRRLS